MPARIRIPGWLTARRYAADDGITAGGTPAAGSAPGDAPGDATESFLAYYDLADLSLLRTRPYRLMREHRSPSERLMLGKLPPLDRQVYRPLPTPDGTPAASLGVCGPLLLCVWWQPAPGSARQFHDWYDNEHIPLLSRIPGWLRSRRFELTEGDGPAFLAMHDLANTAVFTHPGYRQATSTPRRTAATASRIGYERVLYRLLRKFDTA